MITSFLHRLRAAHAVLTPMGRTVVLASVAAWALGWRFGWPELLLRSMLCATLLALAVLFTVGTTRLRISLEVQPHRVAAGSAAAGQVRVASLASIPTLPLAIEVEFDGSVAVIQLPILRASATLEEIFLIPTSKRGVITVGPALTVRGDPLGLFRRTRSWGEPVELLVHPPIVALGSLSSGLLRDLEGRLTNALSTVDFSFHTLRKYVPGDDRRAIHWRSSAKLAHTGDHGDFLVRQYFDTRRPHIAVIVDTQTASYADPDGDFETALSIAASVAAQAHAEALPTSVFLGDQEHLSRPAPHVLDAFARARLGERGLRAQMLTAARTAPMTSLAVIVTGSGAEMPTLRHTATQFPPETAVLVVVADADTPAVSKTVGPLAVLKTPSLAEFPALLRQMTAR